LARLRSSPSLDEVSRFERELGCERLRPQIARLRESLSADAAPAAAVMPKPVISAQPPAVPAPTIPRTSAGDAPTPLSKQFDRIADLKSEPKPPLAAADQEQACKQDAARISRLRASPSLPDVISFERELACEKLRPQLARIRESLAPGSSAADSPISTSNRGIDAAPSAAAGGIAPDVSCDSDRARLARLRKSRSLDDVIRFEKELQCDALRPQIQLLRQSLSGG
jgi:hypothetical protein